MKNTNELTSYRANKLKLGFTFVELVITTAIAMIILTFGLIVSVNVYRQQVLGIERDNIVSLLRSARNRAVDNVNQSNHGLYIGVSQYTLFQGDSYASRTIDYDFNVPRTGGLAFSGISEVRFSALDGSANVSGSVSVSSGVKTSTITINNEGRIDW